MKAGRKGSQHAQAMEEHPRRFAAYLAHNRGYSEHTVRNYVSDVKQFLLYLQEREPACSVESADDYMIRGFLSSRFAKNSKASLARKLSALRGFYDFLLMEGKVSSMLSTWETKAKLDP